jgi:nicotinate phosphoribosyltransferase
MATNGARMKWVAGENKKCLEFGLRRAQGPNGAMTASKYSYLGGFDGTSNVYAGYLFGIPVMGTHAHSFVMSFDSERDIEEHKFLDNVDVLGRAMKIRQDLGWD